MLHEENFQLKRKFFQLELVIKKMTEEKRRMETNNKLERRWRDKKEVGLVIGVGLCAMLNVVLARTVRGLCEECVLQCNR
jgi:hypothetical protein